MWLQLAQISDEHVAARLVHMAEDFRHKAKEIDSTPSIIPQGLGAVRAWVGVASGQRRCGWSATPMILLPNRYLDSLAFEQDRRHRRDVERRGRCDRDLRD